MNLIKVNCPYCKDEDINLQLTKLLNDEIVFYCLKHNQVFTRDQVVFSQK